MGKVEIKPIGARDWQRELNSEAFLSVAKRAIGYTRERNLETGFDIDYSPGKGFLYPISIEVGDNGSIKAYEKRFALAIEAYRKQHGREFPTHDQNNWWGKMNREATERFQRKMGGMLRDVLRSGIQSGNLSKIVDSEEYKEVERVMGIMKEAEKWVDMNAPHTLDSDLSDEMFEKSLDIPEGSVLYNAIHFHTHPTGYSICPSPADLMTLNLLKRQNQEAGRRNNHPRKLIVNPAGVVAGAYPDRTRVTPILIYQENGALPHEVSEDKSKTLSNKIVDWFDPERRLLEVIFGVRRNCDADVDEILKEYNLLPAVYDSIREKIRLGKGVNWSDLCRIVNE